MNKFKRGLAVVLAGLALWMASSTTYGLGLGHPVSRAILGDTLSVSVPVRLDAGEALSNDCVKADVYFGDDKVPAARVQTQLNTSAAPIGHKPEQVIQVRTSALINEPVVTVYVAAGCQTRITRKLVALVDPPDLSVPTAERTAPLPQDKSAVAEAAGVDASTRALHPAAPPKLVRDPSSRTSGLGRKAPSFSLAEDSARPTGRPQTRTQAQSHSHAKSKSKSTAQKAAPAQVDAPRLVLDPIAVDATVAPGLQMTRGLSAVSPESDASSPEVLQRRHSAAAIWRAMNASPEEMARDQARLAELEHKLDSLSRDSARASEAVTGLQNRLAHLSGGSHGMVPVLGALVVLLLGVLAWREWALRKALAEQSSWLASQSPDLASWDADDRPSLADAHSDDHAPLSDIHQVLEQVDAEVDSAKASGRATSWGDQSRAQDDLYAPIQDVPAPVPPRSQTMKDVSIDELIDLEQQAEFFLVLGQDDSAIEVLEGYISNNTAASPMPFLKLLEIYRRLGMRGAYERTRMNFNLRFNAHASLWDADMTHGHELKDYPGVVERLQALWAYPDKALAVLERSLMRQDAESYTFDLPAYRELLFLYAILRDLQERQAPGGEHHHTSHLDLSSPLMATLPMKALPDLAPTLSLDLELDDLYVEPAPTDHKP